ncbi:MAG: SpoIIE family protein phosphatase [Planctomycetaceae bacterium]|nr:SpoIIE family protein phosphatase [Planctomycetaceae bacterium]
MLTTAGVVEAGNPGGELFGRKRLAELVASCEERPPREVVMSIRDAMLKHQQGQKSGDDVTILVLEANAIASDCG